MSSADLIEKLKVLLVPDLIPWVTGTISKQIAYHNDEWIEATICSGQVLISLIERCGKFPGEVDLVHFMTSPEATILLDHFAGKVPCVITIHHVENASCIAPEPRCDAVMTSGSQWTHHLIESGIDQSKLVVVPYGVDANCFRPPDAGERPQLRERIGLPPVGFVVGFFAKRSSDSSSRKGIDVLVRAIMELRQKLPHVALLIVGPGWSDIAEQIRSDGITCVHIPFVPNQDSAELYRCLDAYWITSRIEGGPVPLLEAMSSGVCCITTPVGMVVDIVRDGENGFIVPFDDSEAFVRCTEALVNDPVLRERIGDSARRTIVDKYQWSQTTRGIRPLYQTAIERFKAGNHGVEAARIPEPRETSHQPKLAIDSPRLVALPSWARSWVTVREHLFFSSCLRFMGEDRVADQTERERLGPWRFVRFSWWKFRYDQSLRCGWKSFNDGHRRRTVTRGIRTVLWCPWRTGGWRLLACALIKPMRGSA